MTLTDVDNTFQILPKGVEPHASYSGRFGPMQARWDDGTTTVTGGPFGEVIIPWTPQTSGRQARARIRAGFEFMLGDALGIVRQPRTGMTRWSRIVHVGAGDRAWRWRHRGWVPGHRRFESGDGTAIARCSYRLFGRGHRLAVSTTADATDITAAVSTWAAGLQGRARSISIFWEIASFP